MRISGTTIKIIKSKVREVTNTNNFLGKKNQRVDFHRTVRRTWVPVIRNTYEVHETTFIGMTQTS